MLDIASLKTGFYGLVGYDQAQSTDIPQLTSGLLASSSGLKYNDASALLSTENIYRIASPAHLWADPDTQFSVWLEAKTKDYIADSFSALQGEVNKNQRTLLNDGTLFESSGRRTNATTKSGRFVGFQIFLQGRQGMAGMVKRIMTQFTATQELTLYLFHDSQPTSISTLEVTHATANRSQWHEWNVQVSKVSFSQIGAGGAWYVGYFEDDLDNATLPVATSGNHGNYANFCNCGAQPRGFMQYASVRPVSVSPDNLNGRNSPNFENVSFSNTDNFGLNLSFNFFCDYTQVLIDNKASLSRFVQMHVAKKLMELMAFPSGVNGDIELNSKLAFGEVRADAETANSFSKVYEDALAEAKRNIQGLGSPCLKKDEKGMQWGVVGVWKS